jgi:hypothetical protein
MAEVGDLTDQNTTLKGAEGLHRAVPSASGRLTNLRWFVVRKILRPMLGPW